MLPNANKEFVLKKSFLTYLIGVYVLLVGIGLPLVVRDKYFDILVVKYYYYCFCTITMLLLFLMYLIINRTININSTLKGINIKYLVSRLTIVDVLILLYWIIAFISTLTSNYVYEAFWGNEGRYTGLFLITLYVLSYFCVSRLLIFKRWYLDSLIATGIGVCIFGITDYFNLDIFNFKSTMLIEQKAIFTSTIGNINTYTAYLGIVIGIVVVLFAAEKDHLRRCFYYVGMVIGFFAIIMGVSDNAYLSLAALFGLLPLYLFNNSLGVKRYLIIIATFFTVIQCIDWINLLFANKVIGIDSAFNYVIGFKWLHYLVILLWSGVVLFNITEKNRKNKLENYGNKYIYAWIAFISLVILGILFVLYDCNIAGNIKRYSFASNYFLLNDDWGTHRGYIWRKAMECFFALPTWNKIVGYGPETFGILLLSKTMDNPYNEVFDSAHNEYIHSLITVGILGMAFYVLALIVFIKRCYNEKNNNPYILAIAFGVICYSVQAFVNLNLPIVTPILWLLLSMGSAKSLYKMKV